MELTLEQALLGKRTRIKNKEYLSAEAYITPFIEKMSKFTQDFRIQAIPANQISLTSNGEMNLEDMVFNRMWIQAVMPNELCFENHDEVIGMVYGLDVRKPVAKLYRGVLNRACTNLGIFDYDFLNVQELEPESQINYRPIKSLLERTSTVNAILQQLKDTEIKYDEHSINKSLGKWVRGTIKEQYKSNYGKVKLASSTAIDAYKLLYEDDKSPYFVPEGTNTDLFNIYNAWTQVLTNDTKDIVSKAEKTLLISNILGLI